MATDNLGQLNPNPLVSTQDNPFLEAAREQAGSTQDNLKQSFQVVAGKDPDHIAQVQRMSNQLRIDTGFVERNFDMLQKKLEPERVDYDKLASENPGVSRFLENSDNAAIAKDDLNAISAVEKPIKGYYAKNTSRPFSEYAFDFAGAANRGGNNLAIGALHTLAAYGKIDPVTATGYAKELYAKQKRLDEEKPQYLADLSAKLEMEKGDVEEAGKQFWRGWDDRIRGKTAQGLKDMYFGAAVGLYEVLDRAAEYPLNPTATTNLLVENLAQMVPTLLTSAGGAAAGAGIGFSVAGPPGAIVGGVIGQGTGNFIGEVPIELGSSISDDFQKLGIDTSDDQQLLAFFSNEKLQKEIRDRGLRKGLGTAGVDSLFAAFSGRFSAKASGLGSRAIAAAKDVAVGATGDFLSEGVGQAAREKNLRDVSFNDMIDEVALGLFHNAAETAISVSTRRSIEAAQSIRERLSQDPVRAGQEAGVKGNEAMATIAEIKDVNDAIEKLGQTKLLDRSPDAAKTMVEHIKDSTDGEDDSGTSYFQTADWDKFWTDNKVDPRDAANLLLNDDGKAYDEAKQTGATFSVDTADLMIGLSLVAKQSAISGDVSLNDIAGNVLKIMRTKPDGMSAIEAAEYLRDLPQVYKQLGGEVVASEEQAAKAAALPAGEVAQDTNQIPLPIATREEQVNQIRQNITQQLVNTGMNQKEARVQAQLYEGGIRSLSERSGMTPEEIFKRFGPQIQRVSEIKAGGGVGYNQTVDEKNAIGRFFIGQDGNTKIQLTPNANKSTFLHETGHFFLEIFGTLVSEGHGDEQFRQDYQTILDWFGVKSKDDIKVEHHEKFARGFEKYLGEGLAPSSALQRAFNNFKIWLVDLYKNLKNLNAPLTKEVREVMDRLLATDEEIRKAKGDINFEPIFEDPKIYGFTDQEAAFYSNALADAESYAKQTLDQELFQEVRAERKRQVRDEAKRMEKVIEAQLNQRQEIIIQSIVGDGVMPDGTPLPNEVPAVKITRESVKRLFGEDAVVGMKNKYFSKEGSDIEFAAAILGLETPKELFNILKFGKDKDDLVKQLSNLAAYQKFPSILFSQELSKKAKDAYYNENRSRLLAAEVAFMRDERVAAYKGVVKKLITKPLNSPEAKARAARILGNKELSELRPRIYQLAESKASREAAALFNQNDLDGAIMAKERQLLNHELYRGAMEAQKEIEKAEVKFKEIFKDSEELAKTREMNYVSAARAILAKFELGPEQDLEPVQYLDKIKDYDPDAYNDMISLTNSVLMDIKPADQLTYDNFLNLRDNVLAMWDLAKDHKEIETAKGKMLVEDAIDDLSVTMDQKDAPAGLAMTPDKYEGIKQYLLGLFASGVRVEAFVDYMDRNKLGIWNRAIWQPVKEATAKWREAKTKSREKFLNIFREYGSIENNDPIEAPEINFKFRDKWELLTAILHTGNESNERKLLLGRGWAALDQDGNIQKGNWDRFVKRMRDTGVLGKKEFDFAQKVWDLFEEHLPLIQQAHKKLLGRYFDTVVAKPFSNEFGEYRGGYVPAKYSTLENEAASLRADKKALEDTPNSFMYPDTGRGMTKSRIENYAAPMDLNILMIPGAIDDSLRFALIQPAIKDVSKIVMNKRFRENLSKQNSQLASEMLVPWLQRSAKQQVTFTGGSGKAWKGINYVARWLRSTTSMNIMALSVGNALQQTTGGFIAAVKVPPRKLLTSLWAYMQNSSGMAEFINNKSQFMRTFGGENSIELQNNIDELVLNPTKYETTKKFMQKNAQILSSLTQGYLNNVVWHAAYEHAIESKMEEHDAISLADKAVTRTQGTPFPEDISRIETGNPTMRLFTMFYSYFNMMANLHGSEFATTVKTMGLKKGASRLFYVYAMGFMLPAIGSELITTALSGKGLDEDDDDVYIDDLLSIFFGSQFRTATLMAPGVGQLIQTGVNNFNKRYYDDNIRLSPVISQLETGAASLYTVPSAIFGDGNKKKAVRDGLTALGILTGIPGTSAAKPITYLMDVSEGDADPTGPIDFTRGLITGKPGRR